MIKNELNSSSLLPTSSVSQSASKEFLFNLNMPEKVAQVSLFESTKHATLLICKIQPGTYI